MTSTQDFKIPLTELGQSLGLPDACDKWARQQIHKEIFERLKKYDPMEYSINRTKILGSAAKKTGLWVTMDYDCVVFVNKSPPKDPHELTTLWSQILEDWKKALKDIQSKICTHRGMKITLNGIEIDLLIAFDATGDSSSKGSRGRLSDQYKNTLEVVDYLHARFNKGRFSADLSTSLSELAVFFMKSKNPVTHELARVAKLWVHFAYPSKDYYVSGKSTVIELIVAAAVQKSRNSNNIEDCLVQFLELMIDYSNLDIDLQSRKDLERQLKEGGVVEGGAVIMDPSNPYNNLYDGKNVEKFLELYSHRARETLTKMNRHKMLDTGSLPFWLADPPWLTCLKFLYVDSSAERYGIYPPQVDPWRPTFYISLSQHKVYLPKLVESFDSNLAGDLMNFICFNAAFIPRSVDSFEEYCDCLQKCLEWTADSNLAVDEDDSQSRDFNFIIEYPVAYSWAEGIIIEANI